MYSNNDLCIYRFSTPQTLHHKPNIPLQQDDDQSSELYSRHPKLRQLLPGNNKWGKTKAEERLSMKK